MGQQEEQPPQAPLTHSRTLTKPRGSRSMLKSILKPTITESPREPARTRELLQHPQHLPIRAPPATPPTWRWGQTHPQMLSWGFSALALSGEMIQWLSQRGTALAILGSEAAATYSSLPSSASSSLPTQHTFWTVMCVPLDRHVLYLELDDLMANKAQAMCLPKSH